MDVVIASTQEMANGDTKVGNGTLYISRHMFTFEENPPRQHKENPLLYPGTLFKLRKDSSSNYRFTAIIHDSEVDSLITAKGKAKAINDLMSAIAKIKENKYPD